MKGIYATRGRAREFCEFALNIYSGCSHGCIYCFAPDITRRDRDQFKSDVHANLLPRDVQKSAAKYAGLGRTTAGPVLLSFTSDPYQPIEEEKGYTRMAIETLNFYHIPVVILTKAGKLAQRDLGLLQKYRHNEFAVTMTSTCGFRSRRWEPNAAGPIQRLENLIAAHDAGIKTWVSLEPVIYPEDTHSILDSLVGLVDHVKISKINYHFRESEINWAGFLESIEVKLRQLKMKAYIKTDLAAFHGKKGYWINVD